MNAIVLDHACRFVLYKSDYVFILFCGLSSPLKLELFLSLGWGWGILKMHFDTQAFVGSSLNYCRTLYSTVW